MELDILGSGEAYDNQRINAAVRLIKGDFQLLIDCGPTVPQALWQRQIQPDQIQAVYFTHCHPDHVLGFTTWLNWCESCGRTAPLQAIAPRRQLTQLQALADFAFWPANRPQFAIHWLATDQLHTIGPWQCQTAATRHSVPNVSLLLTGPEGSLFYSGDGSLSPKGEALLAQADMALVECFSVQDCASPYHGSWSQIQHFTRKPSAMLGLYHVQQMQKPLLQQTLKQTKQVFLPEQGERWQLHNGIWLPIAGRQS
ncbi:MBL fold metallo-hydrolase [Pectobacteriaceae bacterium CE90]|nr:MBL fold metallo-hydrolase [Pectobacteriaceae bacterium CE90]